MRSERDEKQTKEKKKKDTEKKMKKKDRWRDTRGSNREGVFSSWSLPTTRGGCNKVTKFTLQDSSLFSDDK